MFAVGTGYNSLFVTLGVFDTKEQAEQTLKSMGAKWVEAYDRPWKFSNPDRSIRDGFMHTGAHWENTEEFSESMEKLNLPWYSTGEIDWLEIKEFIPNTIAFGYNDD